MVNPGLDSVEVVCLILVPPIVDVLLVFSIKEGAKRKVFARDPIFGGSCVPKPLPL